MQWPRGASIRAAPSTAIRAVLVLCGRDKMAGGLRKYSTNGLARSLFPGLGGSELSLCSPASHSAPAGASLISQRSFDPVNHLLHTHVNEVAM